MSRPSGCWSKLVHPTRPCGPYLLFPPPMCTAKTSHAWKQMTHFIVRTCTHPGAPIVLAGTAQAVGPILAPLWELAGRDRASLPEWRA
jgi:hypothetical protein